MHVMIDLATLSLRADARIIQIGAVEFEPVLGGRVRVDRAFKTYVDPSLGQANRDLGDETLRWWRGQDSEHNAFAVACAGGLRLTRAMTDFLHWWQGIDPVQAVWSHGAAFDIAILGHALTQFGFNEPWGHRDVRDTRTLYFARGQDNHPGVKPERIAEVVSRPLIEHDALDDAILQCLEVQAVVNR